MSSRRLLRCHSFVVVVLAGIGLSSAAWAEPPRPPTVAAPTELVDTRQLTNTAERADVSEPQVLEKGPIHEAFAEPLMLDRQSPQVVAKQPPEPINELPPDEQPTGKNIQWVGGYWAFHDDVGDYVWVSGFWRDVPPGREWFSGQWHKTDGGYVWSPGFWAKSGAREVQVVPTPPESLEQGPSSPAPGDNYLWAPGSWRFEGGAYLWQSGFWYAANPDWVWVPNHYCYTAQGSVYVGGYWDYPLARRGLLYAPVYWSGGYGSWHVGAYYRPSSIINTGILIASLFVHRHHGHYYYGYGRGALPHWLHGWGLHGYNRWGNYGGAHHKRFDPVWAHYRWHDRHGRHGNHRNEWARRVPGKGHVDRHALNKRPLVTQFDRLDRRGREALRLRHVSANEVAQYKRKADQRGKVARVFADNRKQATGRVAHDSDRRALTRTDAKTNRGRQHSDIRSKTGGLDRVGRNTTSAQTGNNKKVQVRSGYHNSRKIGGDFQKSNPKARVQPNRAMQSGSRPANLGGTTTRGTAQFNRSETPKQKFHQFPKPTTFQNNVGRRPTGGNAIPRTSPPPGVRSFQPRTQPRTQHRTQQRTQPRTQSRVMNRPSNGTSQQYRQRFSPPARSSFHSRSRGSMQNRSSSRSFHRPSGRPGNRGGTGGGKGRGPGRRGG